jgi:nitrogen-specific signal transduction histidine kinase
VLAEQVQHKTELLDTLAQEVRPPLITLKGALTLLREEPVDPEDRRAFLALANENVVELLNLIDRYLPPGTGRKGTAGGGSPEE